VRDESSARAGAISCDGGLVRGASALNGRLENRVAIVTGTARGIGAAIARQFAAEGAIVHGVDVLAERGEASAREVAEAGGRMRFHLGDVSNEDDVKRIVRAVEAEEGRIDILVNNAAVQKEAVLTDVTIEDFHRIVDVNLLGLLLFCREVIPCMVSRRSGAIVNLSSVLGWVGDPLLPVYAATKAGILGLTRTIGITYAEHGIRCNAICPGDVDTELNQAYFNSHPDPAAFRGRVEHEYPMRRIASTDEIACVAVFLASDDASFVTGTDIIADGGILARVYDL
jgi:NAD(P)-dependent dehydrogenase (short-subunit alcohol dehydrogenase family)